MAMTAGAQAHLMRHLGLKPHALVKTVAGVLWECISYPYPYGNTARVLIRVPGDPTTLRSVVATYVHPETSPCGCALAGEFYFHERADRAELRRREIAAWQRAGVTEGQP